MKLSQISLRLFATALILFVAVFITDKIGSEIRSTEYVKQQTEKALVADEEMKKNPHEIHFGVYGGSDEPERNWAENLFVLLLVFALSTGLTAVWMLKRFGNNSKT